LSAAGAIVGAIFGVLIAGCILTVALHFGGCVNVPCLSCIPHGRAKTKAGAVHELFATSGSAASFPAAGSSDPTVLPTHEAGAMNNPVGFTVREQRVATMGAGGPVAMALV
jgi:hypothetical protein